MRRECPRRDRGEGKDATESPEGFCHSERSGKEVREELSQSSEEAKGDAPTGSRFPLP
jgi:hypothetical protein